MFELVMAAEEASSAADEESNNEDDPDKNGDRDDLIDYLDSDKISENATFDEATEWKEANADKVADYLNSNKNNEYRELFDRSGNEISAREAKEAIGGNQFKAVIFSPELNFNKKELHELADKLISNKESKLNSKDGKLEALYAVHMRSDGTNGHIHIVYHSKQKETLQKALVNHQNMTKEQKAEWIIERSQIVDSVKPISELEKSRNQERLESLHGKSRDSGTQKIDKMIERYMGKSEKHKNVGNLSKIQIEKSLERSVSKSSMTTKSKDYYLNRLEGRLNNLEKAGICKKIDGSHWKFNRDKWIDFQKKLEEAKFQKIDQRVANVIDRVENRILVAVRGQFKEDIEKKYRNINLENKNSFQTRFEEFNNQNHSFKFNVNLHSSYANNMITQQNPLNNFSEGGDSGNIFNLKKLRKRKWEIDGDDDSLKKMGISLEI